MQERMDLASEATSTISLREYGDILRRRRVIILQTFVIVLVAGVLITLFQPLVYQASARLLLQPPSYTINMANNDPLAEIFGLSNKYTPQTQVELLKSKKIRTLAAGKMTSGKGLTGYNVSIVEGGTSIVEIVAEGDDPNAVSETANNILNAFIEDSLDEGSARLKNASAEAASNLKNWNKEKDKAELNLLEFQTKNKVSIIQSETEQMQKTLGEITQTYLGQVSQINYLTTRITEVQKWIKEHKGQETEPALPSILMDPNYMNMERNIAEREATLAAKAGDFGENSDVIIALKSELVQLKRFRDTYKKNFEKGGGNRVFKASFKSYQEELEKLRIDLASLRISAQPNAAKIEELKTRLTSVPNFASKIAEFEQKRTFALKQIEYFTTTKQNIDLRLNTKADSSHVIEEAQVPSDPIRPKKPQNILFSGLLGIFLGLCLALLQELLDDRINSPEEAERVLRLPNLGHVPLVEEEGLRLIRDISTFSPLMESYRSLRTNINFAAVGSEMRSIVVTSSVPAEGKSTTAANLAMAMALDGKRVIIVDADLRRPSLHKLFRTDSSPGLTDVLVGTHEIEDVVRSSGVENVSVIPAGSPPPNPSELLGSARMGELIGRLQEIADVVLFDTPPTLAVADSVVLASRTDGVLLVIGYGETKKANSKKALDHLRRANARVLGTVLNRVEGPNSGYYYGKYYVPASVEGASRPAVGSETRALSGGEEAEDPALSGRGRD